MVQRKSQPELLWWINFRFFFCFLDKIWHVEHNGLFHICT